MIGVSRGFNVAIVGATGAVGTKMREVLEERDFPVANLSLFANKTAGTVVKFKGMDIVVKKLPEDPDPKVFEGMDFVLFSATEGVGISERFAPAVVEAGGIAIDNSRAFRLDPLVPLVVPEVNPHALRRHKGIIANPNCSTIQMVVALKPLHDVGRIKRIVVSTYQSVSGTGAAAMSELIEQTRQILEGKEAKPSVYPHRIAFNVIPHIDSFLENGYTREEMKMVQETRKIMEDESMRITATTVRVPVLVGHAESINVEFERKITAEEAREILKNAPGVIVMDDPSNNIYPMPIDVMGRDEVFVGRIREDESVENGLSLWVVADNLRKGAATNAIQIAELLSTMI
jgi:aspartate-semialdehyde dehydrogenase